jgi:hypothetical protein
VRRGTLGPVVNVLINWPAVTPYEFVVNSGTAGSSLHTWYTPNLGGWRWMRYDELREWRTTAGASYVVRPYCARGGLAEMMTPEEGDLSVATALIQRRIPVPHELLPYPPSLSRSARGLIMAANARLHLVVKWLWSIGTAAIVDTGRPLPGLDLLPEPMRWENPLRLERHRMPPWLPRCIGRERNLPSGTALKPVILPHWDLDYFAPLAVDPARAAAAISPELLRLTRDLQVGWWSEGTTLFVWRHDPLPPPMRPRLAEQAQRIHRLLAP